MEFLPNRQQPILLVGMGCRWLSDSFTLVSDGYQVVFGYPVGCDRAVLLLDPDRFCGRQANA